MATTITIIATFIAVYFTLLQIFLSGEHPRLYKRAIKRYKKEDSKMELPKKTILCTGSSVMKFWKSCEEDLLPYPVLNRAIAGTKVNEIAYWSEDLIIPYDPIAILLYAGSNDIQGMKAKKGKEVFRAVCNFVEKIRSHNPELKLFYISICPAPNKLRWKHKEEIFEANKLIKEFLKQEEGMYFIDIMDAFLTENGMPDKSLFKADRIHLNEKGYETWTKCVYPVVDKALKPIFSLDSN